MVLCLFQLQSETTSPESVEPKEEYAYFDQFKTRPTTKTRRSILGKREDCPKEGQSFQRLGGVDSSSTLGFDLRSVYQVKIQQFERK